MADKLQKEPYVVLSNDNENLTFYYDHLKFDRNGRNIEGKKWREKHKDDIETVYFDESFANCHNICSTREWFRELKNLTSVVGLNNLDTSTVTDMAGMFYECQSLQSLDLSSFDTSEVINMENMFYYCESLQSLYLSNFFDTKRKVTDRMFDYCPIKYKFNK